MAATITLLSIGGYRSISRLVRFPLRSLNVFVGANGAGKGSVLGLLDLVAGIRARQLKAAVRRAGGADTLLHGGRTVSKAIEVDLRFGDLGYVFALWPTWDDSLGFISEQVLWPAADRPQWVRLGEGQEESALLPASLSPSTYGTAEAARQVLDVLAKWAMYHFGDTSPTAGVRRWGGINDDERLRPNASNLAAFLHRIRHTHPEHLARIRDVVRLAAPFFDDFKLRPIPTNPDQIQLEWTQVGTDYPFRPSQLSDGTLRFICLATVLLQPDPPAVMMFDEPELGLHPYALTLLAALFRQAADGPAQVIVSTQSATLLNEFDAEDVIVVERANGASTFRRLDPVALTEWLAEYSVGELWQKNVIGGQPSAESGGPP